MHFHGVYETRMIVTRRVIVFIESMMIPFNLFLQYIDRATHYAAGIRVSFQPRHLISNEILLN